MNFATTRARTVFSDRDRNYLAIGATTLLARKPMWMGAGSVWFADRSTLESSVGIRYKLPYESPLCVIPVSPWSAFYLVEGVAGPGTPLTCPWKVDIALDVDNTVADVFYVDFGSAPRKVASFIFRSPINGHYSEVQNSMAFNRTTKQLAILFASRLTVFGAKFD